MFLRCAAAGIRFVELLLRMTKHTHTYTLKEIRLSHASSSRPESSVALQVERKRMVGVYTTSTVDEEEEEDKEQDDGHGVEHEDDEDGVDDENDELMVTMLHW